MINKEKYPNAKVCHCNFSYGTEYYVLLEGKVYGSIYLVNGQPNEYCFYGLTPPPKEVIILN